MSRAFVICDVMSTMSVSLALRTSAFYFKSMGFVAHPFHLHAMWIGCKRNAGLPENLDRLARFSQPKHDAEQQRLGFRQRSEEHTSELQSLLRISYAVFCLKKKKK